MNERSGHVGEIGRNFPLLGYEFSCPSRADEIIECKNA